MNPFTDDEDDDADEQDYVCKSCGEPWEEEATAFYVDGRCANCQAPGSANKVPEDRENPLTREGGDDE